MSAPPPAASVVMTVYNGQRFLAEQMDSVISQLRPEDEFIVVDDGSTDDSATIVQSFAAPNIRVVRNAQNLGLRQTLQRGLLMARNDVIFLCDQDDVWLPGKRDACVAALAGDSGAVVVLTDAEVIDASGALLSRSFITDRGGFDGSTLGTLWRNRYLGCAMAIRRTLLMSALPIPAIAPMHDMWFGVIGNLRGRVIYLPTAYLRYRRHDGNVTPPRHRSPMQMIAWRAAFLLAILGRVVASNLGWYREIK